MTSREIFDKVKNHLLKQNQRSYDDNGGWCLYRSGDLKCAIGCLIPDDLYKEEMECGTVLSLFNEFPELMEKIGLKLEHKAFLRQLQSVHDISEPEEWEANLNALEEEYNNFKGE